MMNVVCSQWRSLGSNENLVSKSFPEFSSCLLYPLQSSGEREDPVRNIFRRKYVYFNIHSANISFTTFLSYIGMYITEEDVRELKSLYSHCNGINQQNRHTIVRNTETSG
jgi:hypothetical protein